MCVHICLHRGSGAVRTSHLPSVHQLLKAEPTTQAQGIKQTIVELPLQPRKDFVPQLTSSASSNFPSGSKYYKKHVPKYTTPFPSPTTSQPTSPVIRNEKKSSSHNNQPLLSSTSKQVKGQIYDLNKMAGAVTNNNSSTAESSGGNFKRRSEGWWNCLSLPTSNHNSFVGIYTTGGVHPPSADPSPSSVAAARQVSLPNLTLPSSVSSSNNIMTTLSPMMTSPTGTSPLGQSKNRTAR